ncbi:hypothetical protein C9I90_00465 [Photobacterium aphoticum]|uniref:Uncharacterized protein n=1 Tax=Photobacterium aphoticum TaxID=754436 RepID=A0A0J1GQ63_9GAMM|nr:hypothetical protein ABT58_05705 [Photobacterium aphoticum]PSU60136.1 hypothetical protein C9I90_00465 [Photobacterium aphoticum]
MSRHTTKDRVDKHAFLPLENKAIYMNDISTLSASRRMQSESIYASLSYQKNSVLLAYFHQLVILTL